MKIVYTNKASESLREIVRFLIENKLDKSFIKKHLIEIKQGISDLLSVFPEAGVEVKMDNLTCRRIMVKSYNVLYRHQPNKSLIQVLLVYKHNQPKLN